MRQGAVSKCFGGVPALLEEEVTLRKKVQECEILQSCNARMLDAGKHTQISTCNCRAGSYSNVLFYLINAAVIVWLSEVPCVAALDTLHQPHDSPMNMSCRLPGWLAPAVPMIWCSITR